MKTIFILLLGAIGFQSFSQIDEVILSGGIGKSTIFGSESWKDPLAAQISIEVKFMELNENASLSAGLGLSLQGAGWEETYFDTPNSMKHEGKTVLTYLNIPCLLNYQMENGFYGEIGLRPGFLLSAKDKEDGETYDYDYIKGFEVGLPFGAGYRINEQISVGARATIGITNNCTDCDESDHNFMVVALVRYFLNLKD